MVPLPPVVVIVAVPSQPGLHVGFVVVFIAKVSTAGSVIVTDVVPKQLFASVPVIVYVPFAPPHKPVIVPVKRLITGVPAVPEIV